MNHISCLLDERAPGDAEFKFRKRALDLVGAWRTILDDDGLDGFRDMPLPIPIPISKEKTTRPPQNHEEHRTVVNIVPPPDKVELSTALLIPIESDLSDSMTMEWLVRLQSAFYGEHALQEKVRSLISDLGVY